MRAVRAFAGAIVAVVLWAAPAGAQTGERIASYTAELTIEADGDLLVRETIFYDFAGNERHGIFRTIPVRFPHDNEFDRIYKVVDVEVTSQSAPDDLEVSDEGGNKVFRIGDPDRTISGRHRYQIDYRVEGALNGFDDHDELYWNALGNDWTVPVDSVQALVRAPAAVTKVACFAGPEGSTLPCDSASIGEDGTARFVQGPLDTGGALTVVAALPKGAVAEVGPILDERWSLRRAFAVTPATVSGAALLGLLGFGWVGWRLWKHGRDRRLAGPLGDTEEPMPLFEDTPSPVEYRPPEGLRPAQIGVLLDEVANPVDVTATIVDLAVRGYLVIEEIPKSWIFGKDDWRLIRQKEADADLVPYEKKLLDSLFEDNPDGSVTLASLKNKFFEDLKEVQALLYKDCLEGKWFTRRPDSVRNSYLAGGIVLLIAGIGLTVLLAARTHAALLGIPVVLTGLFVVTTHRWMPARTASGARALGRIRGFRRFIETAQAERLQFAEEENIFAKYLPYAIVFGATKKWMKAFEDLGDTPARTGDMGWYSSPHPFDGGRFSDSMQSFTTRTSGTIVSTPSSSGRSGFGGGGSSGGGGGGGGGGSW